MNNLFNKEYFNEIIKHKEVEALLITGSYSTNNYDKYSDIDFIIVLNNTNNNIFEGQLYIDNILYDARIVLLNDLKHNKWSIAMFNAYLNSIIYYERTNIIKEIIISKKNDWQKKINVLLPLKLVELSTIYNFNDNWHNLCNNNTHFNKFMKRKDYLSANLLLNIGMMIVLDIFYLMNNKTIPDNKNKIRNLGLLSLNIEKQYGLIKKNIYLYGKNYFSLMRRYKIMAKIIRYIQMYLDINYKLPQDLRAFYYNNRDNI